MSIYLLRGAPASGKSDWVKENDFENITIDSGKVRVKLFGIENDEDGKPKIPQRDQRAVWSLIGREIDDRLSKGQCVILDATNLKTRDMDTQARRADRYQTECYVVDFWSDLTCEECKQKNHERNTYKHVPDKIIERFYDNVRRETIPAGVRAVLTPEEAAAMIETEI